MNSIPKVVFSTTLDRADWNNTRLVSGSPVEEVPKLKGEVSKDIFRMGIRRMVGVDLSYSDPNAFSASMS